MLLVWGIILGVVVAVHLIRGLVSAGLASLAQMGLLVAAAVVVACVVVTHPLVGGAVANG